MTRIFYPDDSADEPDRRKLYGQLNRLSREGAPEHAIVVDGMLGTSAIGEIHLAHYKNKTEPESLVLKSIDLNEQNVFCVTENSKRTTLRGIENSHIKFMSNSKSECQDWLTTFASDRESAQVAKIAFVKGPCEGDGATNSYLCNEYLNEVLVGLTLTKHMKVPHFIKTYDAWIRDATGFVLQEYGGKTVCDRLPDLSFEQFKSIIVQTLVAMAIAQQTLHFKHHDLHLDNVFVKEMDSSSELLAKKAWLYRLPGRPMRIEHHNVLAKIGDYGLSCITEPTSKTRIARVDYPLLDAGDAEWGQWSSRLDNQYSYDALVLLSKFFLEEKSLATARQSAWARDAYNAIRNAWPGVECSLIGRPLRSQEGRATITEILSLPFFSEFHCTDETDTIRLH